MRKGLLISTMLVSVAGLGMSAEAANQCLQTPSCESLGYTQTSCVDNNGVKCPFGNKYFCVCPAKYVYSCSDTGYASGKGTACGGKYTECTCASGYVWENGSCVQTATWGQCTGYAGKNCNIGDILFSDGTCASDVVSGKTPIAVVVYISDEGCGQAVSFKSVGKYKWGENGNISSLSNLTSTSVASKDFASCENSKIIVAAGDKNIYPAAWAAHEYKTEGTSAGDWCLPAAGIFTSYFYNSESCAIGMRRASGKYISINDAFSSTIYSSSRVYQSSFGSEFGLLLSYRSLERDVFPVIEF